jgi:hypothetical protein
MIQAQILQRNTHGRGETRRIHPLALDAQAATIFEKQQIKFGSSSCCKSGRG